jgi:outer membrane protein W
MLLTALITAASLVAATQTARPLPQGPTQSQAKPAERPHTFGIGGSLAFSSAGASGGFRYFFNDRLGVNFTAGWANGGPTSYGGGSTTFVMPSAVLMLTRSDSDRDVDFRPYVGGGLHYVHGTNVSTGPGTTPGPRNDWGMQAFGGVEMSFKSVKSFTLSVEVVYFNVFSSPSSTANRSGVDWTVSAHFYLK